MPSKTNDAQLQEITDVISSVVAKSISNSSQKYDNNSNTYQINSNSTGCNNIKVSKSTTNYVSTSDVFSKNETYQKVVATIVNQITADQANKSDGGMGKEANALAATISNKIQTSLDQETLTSIGNVANISDASTQVCTGSNGGNNIFFTSTTDSFNYYNTVYSSNSTVQSVSADISNMLTADQSNKSTGIIAMIIHAIILIVIVVILIIAVVGGGAALLYVKTMF